MNQTTVKGFFEKIENTRLVLGEKEAEYLIHLVTKPKYQKPLTFTERRRIQHYLYTVYNPHVVDMKKFLRSQGIEFFEIA